MFIHLTHQYKKRAQREFMGLDENLFTFNEDSNRTINGLSFILFQCEFKPTLDWPYIGLWFVERAAENSNYKTDQFYNIDSDLEVASNIEEREYWT